MNIEKNKSLDPKPRPYATRARAPAPSTNIKLLRFQRFNHHELAHGPFVHELDAAGDLGEKRVILAAPDVESGLHASSALPHDDGPAGHHLSAKCLESQPLRVRVAPVS